MDSFRKLLSIYQAAVDWMLSMEKSVETQPPVAGGFPCT